MHPTSSVRIFFATDVVKAQATIDSTFLKNPNWEIVSVSHVMVPGGVSVALALKFIGQAQQFTRFVIDEN